MDVANKILITFSATYFEFKVCKRFFPGDANCGALSLESVGITVVTRVSYRVCAQNPFMKEGGMFKKWKSDVMQCVPFPCSVCAVGVLFREARASGRIQNE